MNPETRLLIEQKLEDIKREEQVLKERKAEVHQILLDDEDLIMLEAEIKDYKARHKKRKDEILSRHQPLIDELAEIREKKRDLELILSGHLVQSAIDTKELQFQDSEGKLYRILLKGKAKRTNQPDLFQGATQ